MESATGIKNIQISADTLKWIAIITMFMDHIGAGIIEQTNIIFHPCGIVADIILRFIGRLAFPIFCFLLVEGFYHTRSRQGYFCKLLLFAVISELPFEILFFRRVVAGLNNVFWTLAIGMGMMILLSVLEESDFPERNENFYVNKDIVTILILVCSMVFAKKLQTDYGAIGILLIFILYKTRQNRMKQCIWGAVVMLYEITAPVAFLLIYRYNGIRKQKKLKYFFYCFYPLHILLLYWIRTMIS